MVPYTRKAPHADTLKYVNYPEPVTIIESNKGFPLKIGREKIEAIEDYWRIDDEWWRSQMVSRIYFAVILASGRRLVVYKDLKENCWYRQLY